MNDNIVLIGFMGSGKTTFGKWISRKYGYSFCDTDEYIEMKEKLYTIPLNDAVNASDECPFCFIERELEQNSLDFVLGNSSSYMESDIRDQTDKA